MPAMLQSKAMSLWASLSGSGCRRCKDLINIPEDAVLRTVIVVALLLDGRGMEEDAGVWDGIVATAPGLDGASMA